MAFQRAKETGMIVGVDPGLQGALAFLDPANPQHVVEIADMLVHTLARGCKTKRALDAHALAAMLNRPLDHVFVEQAQAMPRQGLSSTFAFGQTFGTVIGVLAAFGHPCTFVRQGGRASPVQ